MTETFCFDYSFARPDPDAMKTAGAVGVQRYLAPLPNRKVLTAPERDILLAAGLSITVIWETVNQRALHSGYQGGMADAHTAIGMAEDLHVPEGAAIYYCLEDPTKLPRADWPIVIDYARGVYDAGGPYRRGGYGSQGLIEATISMGFIEFGWQVEGWSTGVSPLCHLFQRTNTRQHPFPDTDENVCLQPDWGQWPLVTPQPGDDDDMAAGLLGLPYDGEHAARLKPTDRGLVAAIPKGGRPYWVHSNTELALLRIEGAVTGDVTILTDADQQDALLAAVAWSR